MSAFTHEFDDDKGGFPNQEPFIFFKGGNDQPTIQHTM